MTPQQSPFAQPQMGYNAQQEMGYHQGSQNQMDYPPRTPMMATASPQQVRMPTPQNVNMIGCNFPLLIL